MNVSMNTTFIFNASFAVPCSQWLPKVWDLKISSFVLLFQVQLTSVHVCLWIFLLFTIIFNKLNACPFGFRRASLSRKMLHLSLGQVTFFELSNPTPGTSHGYLSSQPPQCSSRMSPNILQLFFLHSVALNGFTAKHFAAFGWIWAGASLNTFSHCLHTFYRWSCSAFRSWDVFKENPNLPPAFFKLMNDLQPLRSSLCLLVWSTLLF